MSASLAQWAEASEKDVADALRNARTIADPDYTDRDKEDPTAAERYEANTGTWEQHAHHHLNCGA